MGADISKAKISGRKKKNKKDTINVASSDRVLFYTDDCEHMYENISDIIPSSPLSLRQLSTKRRDSEERRKVPKTPRTIDVYPVAASHNPRGVQGSLTAISRDSAFSSDNSLTLQTLSSIDETDGDTSSYFMGGELLPVKTSYTYGQSKSCCRTEYSGDEICHMVEAFMPLIQDSIRVLEVIPYIHFIDDTRAFRNKERESPRGAVKMLIDKIKQTEESGKWQTFLEALKRGGYDYIHDLLKGNTEKDLTIQRKLLRLFTPRLINRIDPQEFIDHLYEKNVISESDMEEIKCEERGRGPIAASLMLLECVPRKNPDWYDIFVDVLKKCGLEDMVDDFHMPPDSCEFTQVPNNSAWWSSETCSNSTQSEENETFMKTPSDTQDDVSLRSYLTPMYQRYDRNNDDAPLDSGGYIRTEPSLSQPLSSNDARDSNSILMLRHRRDELKFKVEKNKIKKNLVKEIKDLHRELLDIQEDKSHADHISRTPEKDQDQNTANKHQGMKDISIQTSEDEYNTKLEPNDVDRRLKGIEKHMELMVKEVLNMKRTSVVIPNTENVPNPPEMTYMGPLPHLNRMSSYAESGFGSDYMSMPSSAVYVTSEQFV